MDQNQERRRGHFHRGRRGPDRRGPDRRTPPPQAQEQQQGGRDHADVEQIMRDIRSRIAQRHGIELSNQQIQELAARRLEAILDPRSIKPSLLDELRRSAGAPPASPDPATAAELTYTFEDSTLFESNSGLTRMIRRLLSPILKLFFNPNPLIQALHIQSKWNAEASRRDAERDRRQTEWNALHYELVHRMMTEVSRVSLELQSLSMQIESLGAKVDFNERRVRGMEGAMHQARPTPAPRVAVIAAEPAGTGTPAAVASGEQTTPAVSEVPAEGQTSEASRRRRRRRRGRRGSGSPSDGMPGSGQASADAASDAASDATGDSSAVDEGPDDDIDQGEAEVMEATSMAAEPVTAPSEVSDVPVQEPVLPAAEPAAEHRDPEPEG